MRGETTESHPPRHALWQCDQDIAQRLALRGNNGKNKLLFGALPCEIAGQNEFNFV
jgi:hypothetical protein